MSPAADLRSSVFGLGVLAVKVGLLDELDMAQHSATARSVMRLLTSARGYATDLLSAPTMRRFSGHSPHISLSAIGGKFLARATARARCGASLLTTKSGMLPFGSSAVNVVIIVCVASVVQISIYC